MRDKPLWQSSTPHIHSNLTVSNRRKEGSGEWHIKLHVPNPTCLETDPFCNWTTNFPWGEGWSWNVLWYAGSTIPSV